MDCRDTRGPLLHRSHFWRLPRITLQLGLDMVRGENGREKGRRMKDSELSELLEEALEGEKKIVRTICHNILREEMYGEKLQNVVIFHLENFTRNIFDLALLQNLIQYNGADSNRGGEVE